MSGTRLGLALLVVDPGERRLEGRRVAPRLLGVVELIDRLIVQLEPDQRADERRSWRKRPSGSLGGSGTRRVGRLCVDDQLRFQHAAALLVDFMLSKRGQEIAYRQNRWPAYKELATGGPDDVGNRKTVVPDADKWGSRYEELVQLTSLLGR